MMRNGHLASSTSSQVILHANHLGLLRKYDPTTLIYYNLLNAALHLFIVEPLRLRTDYCILSYLVPIVTGYHSVELGGSDSFTCELE